MVAKYRDQIPENNLLHFIVRIYIEEVDCAKMIQCEIKQYGDQAAKKVQTGSIQKRTQRKTAPEDA